VRDGAGVRPTRLARELATLIQEALQILKDSLRRERNYDPLTSDRLFHLNLNDYTQTILLPRLMAHFKSAAPNLRLATTSYPVDEMEAALKHGTLDLAVDCHSVNSAGLYQQKLFDDEFVCLVRKGHPDLRGALTLDQFVKLPHAVIKHGPIPGLIEQRLTKSDLRREAIVAFPRCLLAPFIAARSDLIVVVPKAGGAGRR
jgi:DNA-binding transcriptional LysR family regulator